MLMQHLPSCLALLPVGFAWLGLSPDPPVVSYTTFSPLPNLGTQPKVGGLFLWHCPSGHPAWLLASTAPCGVRTFLRRPADARDRPTNWAQPHYSTESPPCQDVKCNGPSLAVREGPRKAVPSCQILALKLFSTSSISAWRPSAFLEKMRSPSTVTSKTPPPPGIRVRLSRLDSNLPNSASVKLTARGV